MWLFLFKAGIVDIALFQTSFAETLVALAPGSMQDKRIPAHTSNNPAKCAPVTFSFRIRVDSKILLMGATPVKTAARLAGTLSIPLNQNA